MDSVDAIEAVEKMIFKVPFHIISVINNLHTTREYNIYISWVTLGKVEPLWGGVS